ncbi:MAG: Ig-like domain-containing protein, partial [Planctomycetaceae bacterium]
MVRTPPKRRRLQVQELESRLLLTTSVGEIKSGIAVSDDASGTGYVLFSDVDVQTRFSPPPVIANSDHLIAVRYEGGQWQYNDNEDWHDFNPAATDRLLAELDFDADTITSYQCIAGSVNGISHGYANDDLTLTANLWNDDFNTGEFTISGTTFDTSWSQCASVLSVTPDSGETDLVTNASNLTIGGRFDGDPSTLQVRINNGSPYSSSSSELTTLGSNWSLDLTNVNGGAGLADGIYSVKVSVNNVSNVAVDFIEVDSTPPIATIVAVDQDTGTTTDFITTDNRIKVIGTYSQGSELQVDFDGVMYTLGESPLLSSNGSGTWTLDLTSIPLSGGSYDIEAQATDEAGNASVLASQSVQVVTATIDNVTNDTGPADFVTADQEVLISGTVSPGATLSIDINNGGGAYMSGLSPQLFGNSWTLDLTATTLPLDTYTIVANVSYLGNSTTVSRQLQISNACFHVDSFELRDPNDNPISSLANVTVDHDGTPTVAIDLNARKTSTTNIFYVDETAPANGDGLTTATAYQNIAEAFDKIDLLIGSNDAATINVASGTYTWGYQNNIAFDLNIMGQGIGVTNVIYDANIGTDPNNANNTYTAQFRRNSTYIEGITFDGDDDGNSNTPSGSFIVMDVRNADALTIVDSEFKNAGTGDGLNIFNTDTVVVYNSIARDNDGDGFSYSNPNGLSMEVFEAFANGSDNGLNGLWNSQGSTTHESVDIVRVGGTFERNPTNISDVSSGTSWNIDVTTADAFANEQAGQYLNFNVSGGGTAWIVGGNHGQGINKPTVVNAQPGAELRYVGGFGTLDPITTIVTGALTEDNQILVPISTACAAEVSIDEISQDTGDPTDFVTYDQQLFISGSFVGANLPVDFNGTAYTTSSQELTVTDSTWVLDLTATTLDHGSYSVTATATDGNLVSASD